MPSRKRTKTEEQAHTDLLLNLMEQRLWMEDFRLKDDFIPPEWNQMDDIAPVAPKKTKVTLRLNDKTLRWFRAMGPGWQTRADKVLETYMLAVVSREVRTRRDLDWKGEAL